MSFYLTNMLSAKIKEHTASSHKQLESHPLFSTLNGRFEEQTYQVLLHKLYTYYSGLEKQYVPFFLEKPSIEIEKRQRAYVLKNDLANRPSVYISPSIKQQLSLPVIDSIWKATGALYVIEGSTLGGRFICQSLAQAGIDRSNGALYFTGYGEETGRMWKTFIQFMNEIATTADQEQEVIATAEQVFSTLNNWLDKND